MTEMRERKARQNDLLPDVKEWFNGTFIAVPSSMAKALSIAAETSGLTASEYMRRATLMRMSADGIRPEDYDAAA